MWIGLQVSRVLLRLVWRWFLGVPGDHDHQWHHRIPRGRGVTSLSSLVVLTDFGPNHFVSSPSIKINA
jgi:hypothetical protein